MVRREQRVLGQKRGKRLPGKQQRRGGQKRPKNKPRHSTVKGLPEQNTFVPNKTVDPSEALQKPRLEALLFCDYATRTLDGKYILGGIFERFVFTPEEAKVTPYFYLFIRLGRTTDGQIQIALYDPTGTIISAFAFEITASQFQGAYPSQINFLDRVRFHTPVEGVYWFDISYRRESLGGAPMIVEFLKTEAKEDEHESKHPKTQP